MLYKVCGGKSVGRYICPSAVLYGGGGWMNLRHGLIILQGMYMYGVCGGGDR